MRWASRYRLCPGRTVTPRFVLVHGYSGSPRDLAGLASALERAFGTGCVFSVSLHPEAHTGPLPPYAGGSFEDRLANAVSNLPTGGPLVLIGHSTGGTIALCALERLAVRPDLLVLVSTPGSLDLDALERWEAQPIAAHVDSDSVGRMARHIAASMRRHPPCSVLLFQGTDDALVPLADVHAWRERLENSRAFLLEGEGHNPFGNGTAFVIDVLERSLANLPGDGTRVPPPQRLNVEVTTRCQLRCRYCAREMKGPPVDIPPEDFLRILDLVPSAATVTLVGLGDPLLHPDVARLVRMAVEDGRRVQLVTNAMALTPEVSESLARAGLHGITFSIDATDQRLAETQRVGSDMNLILENARRFINHHGTQVIASVFTVLSTDTVAALTRTVRDVASFGVKALMLTDLNFVAQQSHALATDASAFEPLLRAGIRAAYAAGLPILSARSLEMDSPMRDFTQHLLFNPEEITVRATTHTHCRSPWQTLPVNVKGDVWFCDCQPGMNMGNLFRIPFSELWNGTPFADARAQLDSGSPPPECLVCPRF